MSDTPYSARIRSVELLERNKAQVTQLKIYRDNAQVIPTSAKYTLVDPNGEKITDDQTASIDPSGTVSFTHPASDLPTTRTLGEGYIQEFKATIAGVEIIFRRVASLVKRKLYPVISDIDLTAVYSDLESLRPSTLSSYQNYIDEAWYTILRKIRNQGRGFEYLVMSPESFAEAHKPLTLDLIFRDFPSTLGQSNGRFLDLAQEHYRMYTGEWDSLNFIYDETHNLTPDEPNKRTASKPVIFLNTSGRNYRFRRY